MGELYNKWSTAKKAFLGKGVPTADLPPDFAMLIAGTGAGMGPALKDFESADSPPKKEKAFVPLVAAKDEYARETAKAIAFARKRKSAATVKALESFNAVLWEIFLEAKQTATAPRPSGSLVDYQIIRGFNLAGDLKSQYLDVKTTVVEVVIRLDSTLKTLIDQGKESLKIEHVGNVAMEELRSLRGAFVGTIKDIDKKIETKLLGDKAGRDALIAEANAVLKYYARVVEDRVHATVQAEWNKYLERKKYLKDFQFNCKVKVVLGVVAVGVGAASIALSFGAAWANALAIAKAISGIAQTLKDYSEKIDTTYAKLLEDIKHVADLNAQREKAKKEKQGQKASKSKEAAKELAVALLPITKNLVKSAGVIEERAKQFLGQVSKLEDDADEMVGLLNKLISQMGKLPDKLMSPEQKSIATQMETKSEELIGKVRQLYAASQNAAKFGDRALTAVKKLRKEDSWTGGLSETLGNYGSRGVAIYSGINFIVQLADHGKALIPL